MTKASLPAIFLFITFSTFGQSLLPDDFKIGGFLEVYSKDSLKVFFSCTGTITERKCASYYRVGKMDPSAVNFLGAITDFYQDGKPFLKTTIVNNSLEGYAYYYHNSGKISEEGEYRNNTRTGKWIYYYPNGNVEKVYYFDGNEPKVLEAYKKNGSATVVNGNGEIHTTFSNDKQCTDFEISGDIVNGQKNGKWTFSNIGASLPISNEIYKQGIFEKGISGDYVYNDPKIKLTRFYPNENLNLISNLIGCPGDRYIFYYKYDSANIDAIFFPKLQEEINKNRISAENQWIIVGVKIDKKSRLQEINLASSINDTALENSIYKIVSKMTNWTTASINLNAIESNIYFPILVENNNIIVVPDYFNNHNW